MLLVKRSVRKICPVLTVGALVEISSAEKLIMLRLCTDFGLLKTMLIILLVENVSIGRKSLNWKVCVTFWSEERTKLKQKEGGGALAMH